MAELAVEVLVAADVASALERGADIVYLIDGIASDLESTFATLSGRTLRLGLSLDYPEGLNPRYTGLAPDDIELRDALLSRLTAFSGVARKYGLVLETVGCHGDLALDVAEDERCTQVLARALMHFDSNLSLAIAAGSRGIAVAHHCGIALQREARVDHAIGPARSCNGATVPRVDRFRMGRLAEGQDPVSVEKTIGRTAMPRFTSIEI
ncbi:LamB/YcsF family protein [Bordetella sp. N]|uniref:LamB/YcsF family protein n=1 Tax=Bordetella sp. N TaxID=1746199 RepID=UPI001E3763AB|nr:LamB/YcsF family protein [Bordetella sp. N]